MIVSAFRHPIYNRMQPVSHQDHCDLMNLSTPRIQTKSLKLKPYPSAIELNRLPARSFKLLKVSTLKPGSNP